MEEAWELAALGSVMLVGSSHPKESSDQDRHLAAISGLMNRIEVCIVVGTVVASQVEKKMNIGEKNPVWSPELMIWERTTTDMFVFEAYRMLKWLEECRKHQYIPKESPLRPLLKHLKRVRELRDYLTHSEEYIVAGKGSKPKRYLSEKEWGILNPQSSVAFINSTVFGRKIENELHLGNKIEFFGIFNQIQEAFSKASEDGFFTLEYTNSDPLQKDEEE